MRRNPPTSCSSTPATSAKRAAEKVYSELGRLRELKEARALSGGTLTIGVAGCVAQAEGREIVRRAKGVDIVVGPQSYHRLPELIASAAASGQPVVETEFAVAEKFAVLDALGRAGLSHRPGLPRHPAALRHPGESRDPSSAPALPVTKVDPGFRRVTKR